MRYFCGVDIGASAVKLVIIDEQRQILGRAVRRSGVDYAQSAERCLGEALAAAGLERAQVACSISTGYGRDNVPWVVRHDDRDRLPRQRSLSPFSPAHDGDRHRRPGQQGDPAGWRWPADRLQDEPQVCGRHRGVPRGDRLRLDLPVTELNGLAEQSTREVTLGSFCTVFTATEILAKIRAGERVEDIVKGAFRSVVKRIREMGAVQGTMVMTGGVVAHNPVLQALTEEAFHTPALVPPDAQCVGALGAALFALEKADSGEEPCC